MLTAAATGFHHQAVLDAGLEGGFHERVGAAAGLDGDGVEELGVAQLEAGLGGGGLGVDLREHHAIVGLYLQALLQVGAEVLEPHADPAAGHPALVAQLVDERVVNAREGRDVGGAQEDGELIGNDAPAVNIDRAVLLHLADEAAAQLDRSDAGLEGACKHSIDHAL